MSNNELLQNHSVAPAGQKWNLNPLQISMQQQGGRKIQIKLLGPESQQQVKIIYPPPCCAVNLDEQGLFIPTHATFKGLQWPHTAMEQWLPCKARLEKLVKTFSDVSLMTQTKEKAEDVAGGGNTFGWERVTTDESVFCLFY